jgi:hypothetical protein
MANQYGLVIHEVQMALLLCLLDSQVRGELVQEAFVWERWKGIALSHTEHRTSLLKECFMYPIIIASSFVRNAGCTPMLIQIKIFIAVNTAKITQISHK